MKIHSKPEDWPIFQAKCYTKGLTGRQIMDVIMHLAEDRGDMFKTRSTCDLGHYPMTPPNYRYFIGVAFSDTCHWGFSASHKGQPISPNRKYRSINIQDHNWSGNTISSQQQTKLTNILLGRISHLQDRFYDVIPQTRWSKWKEFWRDLEFGWD